MADATLKDERRMLAVISVLSLLILLWTLFFLTPFDIVNANRDEFRTADGEAILANSMRYASLVFAVLVVPALAAIFWAKLAFARLIAALLFGAGLAIWINSTFLVGVYGAFDGRTAIEVDALSLNSIAQLLLMVLVFAFAINRSFSKNGLKQLRVLAAVVVSIAVLTGAFSIFSKLNEPELVTVDDSEFFRYSKSNPNLLFIISDELQGDYFEALVDERLKRDLEGFIWYRDTAANFPTTIAGLPALLTSKIYDNTLDIDEFYEEIGQHSIANLFANDGGVVTYTTELPKNEKLFPPGSLTSLGRLDPDQLTPYQEVINYSLFRASPDVLKAKVYNSGNWLVRIAPDKSNIAGLLGNSVQKLHYASSQKVVVDQDRPTFKFHHYFLTHSPTIMDGRCRVVGVVESSFDNKVNEANCAFKEYVRILDQLKDAGVYDNTMIVISSDHGSVYMPDEFSREVPYSKASSTLLIKPLGSTAPFSASDMPAQLSDIPITVANAFDLDNSYGGVDLLEPPQSSDRVREFSNYVWTKEYHSWSKDRVPPIKKFQINGPLKNPQSWEADKRLPFLGCDEKINFNNVSNQTYYNSAGLSGIEPGGIWADKDVAEISIRVDKDCAVSTAVFELDAFLMGAHNLQKASVFRNGELMENVRIEASQSRPILLSLQLDESSEYQVFRFDFQNPARPIDLGLNNDKRTLSFRFISLEFPGRPNTSD